MSQEIAYFTLANRNQHSHSVMKWLNYVDTHNHDPDIYYIGQRIQFIQLQLVYIFRNNSLHQQI